MIDSNFTMCLISNVQNTKRRFFVLKGCVMMYYQTDLVLTQNLDELPKGVHVVTGVRNSTEKMDNTWVVDTLDGKTFLVTADSDADKTKAVGAFKVCIQMYQKQLKQVDTPNNEIVLGLALCNAGYLPMAIDKLENAVRLNPRDAGGYYHLGTLRMMQEGDEGLGLASAALQRCIELDNNHIDALSNLGLTMLMLSDLDGAHKALTAVLGHTPTHVEAANNLAILYVHRRASGDLEKAEARLQYAIQCDPGNPNLYLTYCDLLLVMGNREGAREILQRGIDSVMGKCSALNYRAGSLLLQEGELEGAIESLKEAVDIDPKNAVALELLKLALKVREEQLGVAGDDEKYAGSSSPLDVYNMTTIESVDPGDITGAAVDGKEGEALSRSTLASGVDSTSDARPDELRASTPANAYSILTSLRAGGSAPLVPSSTAPAAGAPKKEKRRSIFF
jgi:tetratricopeptide (TPR) repeat protein